MTKIHFYQYDNYTLYRIKKPCYNRAEGCDFVTSDVQLRIIRALAFDGDTTWSYRNVNDSYHTIYYIVDGNGHIRTQEEEKMLLPGYVYLIPRGLSHDLWCDTHIRKAYVDFHVDLLPGCDALQGTGRVMEMNAGVDACQRMYRAVQMDTMREKTFVRGQALTTLAEFLPENATDYSPLTRPFLPVIESVQKHLSASIRRDEYAARFGWNASSFSRAFCRAFGVGFKEYVERLLTDRLVEELLVTDKTLQQLAGEWGFCDAYYLSAFFKRRTGISPDGYRRTHLHGKDAANPAQQKGE